MEQMYEEQHYIVDVLRLCICVKFTTWFQDGGDSVCAAIKFGFQKGV